MYLYLSFLTGMHLLTINLNAVIHVIAYFGNTKRFWIHFQLEKMTLFFKKVKKTKNSLILFGNFVTYFHIDVGTGFLNVYTANKLIFRRLK